MNIGLFCLNHAVWLSAGSKLFTPTSLHVVVFPQLHHFFPLKEFVWVCRPLVSAVYTRTWEEREGEEQGSKLSVKPPLSSCCLRFMDEQL